MNPSLVSAWLLEMIASHDALSTILSDRIFPDQAPRGTANPCLVYQLIGSEFEEDLDDKVSGEGQVTIQLRSYAGSRLLANEIRYHLRTLLTDGVLGEQATGIGTFRILRSAVGDFDDTFEEGSEDNGDDYGAVCFWSVDAS